MTNAGTTYNKVEEDSLAHIDFEKDVFYEDEKWYNRVWVSETLGGDYRLFVKTEVTNKSTGKKKSEKYRKTILKKHGWFHRFLGNEKYTARTPTQIQSVLRTHVQKLSKRTEDMKTQEQLLEKLTENIENQMEEVDFESEIEEVRENA